MNEFSGFIIFNTILVILGTGLVVRDLYTISHHGKFIMKVEKRSSLSIFWGVALIFWCFALWYNIRMYSSHQNESIGANIFTNAFWIEFSISNFIRSFISSEIRENGIYKSGYFYKWSKIESYSWVLSNTVQFKVKTFFKKTRSFEISINEEVKLKVDEVVQRKLPL